MSDDFFTHLSARPPARPPSPGRRDAHDGFAHAVSLRLGTADLRTARLLPDDPPPASPPPPTSPAPPSLAAPAPAPFSSVAPAALAPYLDDPLTLLLDIRPHAAHAAARITHALSLSVPTTLLKRPLFSLSKLSQMLPSPSARARFANWSSASCVLVYDADSTSSPDNSIIAGLLRKFRAEGFAGELGWLRGGFQAVWREARHLTTTELPSPEEDDPDPTTSAGTLRTTHLPKTAFSLSSTTAAPPHLPRIPGSHALLNTPAPSTSRAANPFFDTIRQNVELSHGVTERIPLRLPRRVRRRIHDLPCRWLQDIARRSALRLPSASRHPGLDGLESGSESSDDPHTSDPDEHDPNVEEGAEALAMQFYRIELAEQRRLRSIMEHHTRESQLTTSASSVRTRRISDMGSATIGTDRHLGVNVQAGAKSMPGTPHPAAFPFSITAGVEKGTKNRYTHIWPFEHARVRLHDGRHQGSHPGRRDKGKASERSRSRRDRSRGKGKEREGQEQERDQRRRSRSKSAFDRRQDQETTDVPIHSSRHPFHFDNRLPIPESSVGSEAGLVHPALGPSPKVPRVKIEYEVMEQDSMMSGPPTPATALPLLTPPFYTPMETPMRARPSQLLSYPFGSPGRSLGGTQFALPTSSLPSLGPLPSFPLRLPSRSEGLLSSIGGQTWPAETLSPTTVPFGAFPSTAGAIDELGNDAGTKHDPRMESSPVDDYVNASYVQPLGTRKRYIATQGPLPSTYVDFWTLVWEQNVHVIVMLTREIENAMVKCGSYWTDTEYGPLRLELLSTSPHISPSANPSMDFPKQGFFDIRDPRGKTSGTSKDQPTIITRTFAFSHTSYPGVPPRKITHLQYLDWSDMNVPDDPRGVLDLVKRVEKAVAESSPGPSPGGSLSPGSGNGSLSGSQSPDADQRGDNTLLSPTAASFTPRGRRHGNEWRHPELDLKTGIVSSALGKAAPVLLHCSAGVGRTGGFIAVDSVLDGIKRELRKRREERKPKKVPRSRQGRSGANDEASGDISVESTETGIKTVNSSGEESSSSESGRMDVDEPPVIKTEKVKDPLHMINTVPIHVSAGDRAKGRRRRYPPRGPSGEGQCSSSESLVVHVPYAGAGDAVEGARVTGIDLGDPKEVGWQPSSTREWAERVSDQTHVHAEEDLPPPLAPLPSSRERSPGSASNSSGPSALNSADDSVNDSTGGNASGSAGASSGGGGNRMERKSHAGSAAGSGSGSGDPPPSLVSKLGSGSISFSNSGSGTGTGSRLGSSLPHTRLRDSSVTSVSIGSADSLSPEHGLKSSALLHRPSTIHINSSSDMEIDCPPRPASVPLQPAHSSTLGLQRAVHLRYDKPMLGSSPVGSISSPILPPAAVRSGIPFPGRSELDGPASQPDSVLGSDKSPSPSREFENGECADVEGGGKNSQGPSDEPENLAVPTKLGRNLRLNTEPIRLKGQETFLSSGSTKKLPPSGDARENVTIPSAPYTPDDLAAQWSTAATGAFAKLELHQHGMDYPVIDYKLPRGLHSELSPPLISSFAEPICMVIQDMREQRMSLCQSLRQYVFVHAAIIEGALRIVDEEREFWGYNGTSDDTSSAEGELRASVRKCERRSGRSKAKTRFAETRETCVAVKTPDFGCDDIPQGTRPSHTVTQSMNYWNGNSRLPLAPTSSPSSMSSPSKGKRGPSPTELLREDKTGALSLSKRPIIHHKTTSIEGGQASLESSSSSPVAGENAGGLRHGAVGSVTRSTPGRPAAAGQGSSTSDSVM